MRTLHWGWVICGSMLVMSCGGGGGSDSGSGATASADVTGMQIADQMSLVTDTSSATANLAKSLRKVAPTGGDYAADTADVFVYDASMEALDIVNDILAGVDQTRYDVLVNQGAYIALVSTEEEDHGSDSQNQSSGQSTEYESWVVESSRASNDSPQIVNLWINVNDGSEDMFDQLRMQITITEEASESHPHGLFAAHFVGYWEGSEMFTGSLASLESSDGNEELELAIDSPYFSEQVHAILSPDGTSGRAYSYQSRNPSGMQSGTAANRAKEFSEPSEEELQAAFDATHYFTDFGDATRCLDRANLRNNVWSYNLYDTAGTRIDRNSGFSIHIGEEHWGWAGYYGVWVPEEAGSVTNGLVVTDDDGAPYTVFQGGGRLVKRTRKNIALSDLIGDVFERWDWETGQSYLIEWDGSNLVKTGLRACSEGGCTVTEMYEVITLAPFDHINLWKQGFGNLDLVVPESGVLSNDLVAPYYADSFITPASAELASGSLTLHCYQRCPKATIAASELENPFLPDVTDVDNPYVYVMNAADMTLYLDGEPVTLAADASPEAGSSQYYGIMSDAMIPATTTLESIWGIYNQPEMYNWETGVQPWNKYTALLDANGAPLEFESPLQCLYRDATHGTFMLDYQGIGQLHGIPFEKIEVEETEWEHWVSLFAIPDGSELECNGSTYVTKALEIERIMESVDVAECSSLAGQEAVDPPSIVFVDPELGDEPAVTDAPKVVGGEVQ